MLDIRIDHSLSFHVLYKQEHANIKYDKVEQRKEKRSIIIHH